VELALRGDLLHHQIAHTVNAQFAGTGAPTILGNTVTQIICRQRERLAADGGFPLVVARLHRLRRVA
jgi:hypothetical protein